MKSDTQIRDDVINELQWDPQISEPEAIGVAVVDGAVTLAGHVSAYAGKLAAARAAERVYGVKAVANDLKVRLSSSPRDDSDIARAIAHVLEWNVQVPRGEGARPGGERLGHTRRGGRLRVPAARSRADGPQCPGVIGVTNSIMVKPAVTPETVEEIIEEAFKREAEVDARHIKVQVSDHTVKLYGHVHSLKEANAATAAAAAAPGIAKVESHLVVSP
jgi:osmotically-inducible protein OsmY